MSQRGVFAVACALLVVACSDNNEICGDGEDNDSNGQVDCKDSACGVGAVCGPNGLVCASDQTCSACSGNGGTAELNGEQTCGDGVDNDCDGAVDCADADCQPQGTQPGRACDATGRTCSAADAAGISTCGINSGGGGGTEAIGFIRLDSAEHNVLGALGSGYREQSLLTFQVLASDGAPYAGLPVKFSHESQGGSYIGSVPSCTTADPPVCNASGTTDAEGRVGVILHSGTRFAAVSIRAEATAAGVMRYFVAGGLYVIGAKPSGSHFSLVCHPKNIPALTQTDCLYSHYKPKDPAEDAWCTATVGDRHNNLIATPTLVAFRTEAGSVPPATFTPEFDPSTSDPWLGQALGLLNTYGSPLPVDVEPFSWESRYEVDYRCGLRTTNPRDGLVTVMAFVQGEEGFVDLDLNGTYDEGEPFVDLGEPFLDQDDDGVRDADEWYHDTNEDGSYTGPNGRWDGDTVLWTQARVLYTGHPMFALDGSGRELFARLYDDGFAIPPTPTPAAAPFAVSMGPPTVPEFYGVFFTDQHLNPLSSSTKFDAEAMVGNVSANMTNPSGTADSLGMSYRMLYCDRPNAPATCRDGPADQACLAPRCYLQTEVGREFWYGNYATLAVTCAQPGPDVVEVRASVEGVTSSMWISGECLP